MNKHPRIILDVLKLMYPQAKCSLNFSDPWQLLVATILAAQCTDIVVNSVTPSLFKTYPSIDDMAHADIDQVKLVIRQTGFYNNKAKSIIASAQIIMRDFDGKVPQTMEELVTLHGVARKTANIVLTDAFQKVEGIAVDTHVGRISRRLGLTEHRNPVKVENDLCSFFFRDDWGYINHLMVYFGRDICWSAKPRCTRCPFYLDLCVSNGEF